MVANAMKPAIPRNDSMVVTVLLDIVNAVSFAIISLAVCLVIYFDRGREVFSAPIDLYVSSIYICYAN